MEQKIPALAFEGVTFGYGATLAVEDVTFSIEPREFVALIGPNGSGKTTLVKLALGLERPHRGQVHLFGEEVGRFRAWHRVGYVPQQANAFKVRFPATVSDVLAQGQYRGVDPLGFFRWQPASSVQEALRAVGMWEHRSRLISELSVGQQQRVLIGRALVRNPSLLILDEPTSGLDKAGQEQFYELLRALRKSRDMTIVLVSHDIGVVLHEASKVACINGRLQSYTNSQDLTDRDLAVLYGHPVDVLIHRHD
jgi:zinc transport system ATP-binding protein